jgi:hypothetical protein
MLDELAPFTQQQYEYVLSLIQEKDNMKLKITAEDLLRGVIIDEAGWYPAQVTDAEEKISKSGDSNNCNVTLKLLGPEKYQGVIVYRTFNEKAPGMAAAFFVACGAKTDKDGKLIPGEFDFDACKGRKLQAYIQQRTFEGKVRNDVADFRPLT